jgi:sarcosine oxidase subunit gamma
VSAPDALLHAGHHGAPGIPGVTLTERRPTLHQVAARRGAAFGMPAPGRSAPMWGGAALGLAPGTAMLVGGARPELPTAAAAVVDLSDGFAVLRLSGPASAEVLARICRLDLHEGAFPPGACARTPVAQMPAILHRVGPAGFDLLVPATFAHSLVHALLTAAAPFGCATLPPERDPA